MGTLLPKAALHGLLCLICVIGLSVAAGATCPTVTPFPQDAFPAPLNAGTTANGSDVINDINFVLQCPYFTGNIGIGTTSPGSALTVTNGGLFIRGQNGNPNATRPDSQIEIQNDGVAGHHVFMSLMNNVPLSEEAAISYFSTNSANAKVQTFNVNSTWSALSGSTSNNNDSSTGIGMASLCALDQGGSRERCQEGIFGNNSISLLAGYAGVNHVAEPANLVHDHQDMQIDGVLNMGTSSALDGGGFSLYNKRAVIDGTNANQLVLFESGGVRALAIGTGASAISNGGATDGGIAAASANGNLLFGAGGTTEHMRITSTGNVGIGITSPAYTLHVNGSVAGTSAYNNLSDERLKKNIAPIPDALSKIGSLRGVQFDWRKPNERTVGKNLNLPVHDHQVGFVAQEVRRVLPEAVTVAKGRDHLMSIEESKVVPLLVEAVKALKAANDRQAVEIDDLRKQVVELRRHSTLRTASR